MNSRSKDDHVNQSFYHNKHEFPSNNSYRPMFPLSHSQIQNRSNYTTIQKKAKCHHRYEPSSSKKENNRPTATANVLSKSLPDSTQTISMSAWLTRFCGNLHCNEEQSEVEAKDIVQNAQKKYRLCKESPSQNHESISLLHLLPSEIILNIFQFLDGCDILRFSLTSRR